MKDSQRIDESSIQQLEEMVKLYPYSGIFHLLLSKGLLMNGDLSLDEKLKKAAVTIPDRGVLYNLLYSKRINEIVKKVELDIEVSSIENVSEKADTEKVEVKVSDEIDLIEETKEIETITDELERDILLEAINTSLHFDVEELLKEDKEENGIELLPESKSEEEPKVAFSTPLKFSDWLMSMKTKDDKNVKQLSKEVKPLKSSKDLIDNFISTKNKRIDMTKEPLTPQEQGRLSLVDNEDFVTETLANIYAKQGNYLKAIKIYEQLILNFPEKSTFFASRIRFLREKMEYDKN